MPGRRGGDPARNIPNIGDGSVDVAGLAGSMSISPRTAAWSRPSSWPLVVLFCGLPLWWVLGLFSVMPLLLSVPMAWQLSRLRTLHLPRGFGWWLLFLVWVLLGVGVLWADAPGAVAGGGASRLLVFGYRFWWYVACTVVLLWVANMSRDVLPDRRVLRLGGCAFVVTALGGLLGVLRPELEFRSLIELLLPGGLRSNGFVSSLIHPEAAEIQSVLGRPEPRPKAPFPYTNSWGSALSLSLVLFVAALRGSGRSARVAAVLLLGLAVVPVLYSLNRGLWASLGAGAVGLGLLLAMRRRPAASGAVALAACVAIVLGMISPLGGLVQERLAHQHSNDRRGQLLESTVTSVSAGSPLVGFGSTRDVQGSFHSIAGAATADCPACGVPPLGTQGQLWLVLFSQGWPGLAFFLVFVLLALGRCWRCRTVNQTVCTFVLAFFLVQLPIYDSLGLSLFLVMMTVGLVVREDLDTPRRAPVPARARNTSTALGGQVRAALPMLGLLVIGGSALGATVATLEPARYQRSVWIELAPTPITLDRDLAQAGTAAPVVDRIRAVTLDTESSLLHSPRALAAAARITGSSLQALERATTVSALPNTRVLTFSVRASTRSEAVRESDAIAEAYLGARQAWLSQRRSQIVARVHDELAALLADGPSGQHTRDFLTAFAARLVAADTSAGTVVRAAPPEQVTRGHPVTVTSAVAVGLLAGSTRIHRTLRRT